MGGLIFKDIQLDDYTFSALVDTGSDLCIMRYDTLLMLDENIELNKDRRRLVGLKESAIDTLGSFDVNVDIDGISIDVTFHVVKEVDLRYAAIIGNSVLKNIDMLVREGEATFIKRSAETNTEKAIYLPSLKVFVCRSKILRKIG